MTPFEEAVDRVLRNLAFGEIATYGEVAEEAGYPRRARAVGTVLAGSGGRYPWWRVVAADGRLVPGHEAEHARRLRAEGHPVRGDRVVPPGRPSVGDRFDRAYFDRWYRREGFGSRARLDRKVDYALGATEYLLERPVQSVLDVGCGEGAWQPALRARRPRARYVGVDPSTYAVERYGSRRHLRLGALADLDGVLGPDDTGFDLIVCVDVLGYATDRDVRRGLAAIGDRLSGVALVEVYTTDDEIIGDVENLRRRRPATYERWFTEAGLHRLGPQLYVHEAIVPFLTTFERPLS